MRNGRIYSKTIWSAIIQIFMIFVNFFELFFGLPYYDNNYEIKNKYEE